MDDHFDDGIYVDINNRVSKLNRGVLTLSENNELLVKALEYDENCLKMIKSQPTLSKICDYGAKISGIVLDKAYQINVCDARESLKRIIDSFLYKFPLAGQSEYFNSCEIDVNSESMNAVEKNLGFPIDHFIGDDGKINLDSDSNNVDRVENSNSLINDSDEIPANIDTTTPVRPNPHATNVLLESRIQISNYNEQRDESTARYTRELDFISLSKYFYGSSLSFSCLSWDVIPIVKLPKQKAPRKRAARDKISAEAITLDTINQTSEEIENCMLVDRLITKLKNSAVEKLIPFWEFVLDTDEIKGFNNTCYNLYALTLIVSKGHAEITNISNKLYIQLSKKNVDQEKGNSQQILTGWTFDKWKSLRNSIIK